MEQTKHLFRSSRTRQWPLKVRIKRGERFHPCLEPSYGLFAHCSARSSRSLEHSALKLNY